MASITKRASGRWQAKVRRFGQPPLSRTFADRAAAVRWAREMEVQADQTGALPRHDLRRVTLGDLLNRFLKEACPARRGGSYEVSEIAPTVSWPNCAATAAVIRRPRRPAALIVRTAAASCGAGLLRTSRMRSPNSISQYPHRSHPALRITDVPILRPMRGARA